ncbi:outer membrane lipoprotein carrier protein LolA [Sphingobacterium wenxiniae]|uniref:Outer membrane lipoprotein carrier protein n=1 Tax=Sphingobacterium wenxiniae TaxID=683125 RepID=A0A1I6UN71_9SPHI|nr:outer membrane lipoprotein carrier protein LolA [Sphingobacterium wenxiniae]SFT02916.1 outer membrane lipoprotein carrier protein [Sphingobacterium wenxiniae]
MKANLGYRIVKNWVKLMLLAVCLLPLAGWAQMKAMSAQEVQAFQQALKQLATVKTLSADFVQYKHLSFMKKPVESSGKLFIVQPDRLSWSYTAPFNYKMVFKDNKIFINDEGKKRSMDLGNSKQFEKISKLVTNSMQGGRYDEKEFAVAYFKDGGNDVVRLTPKLSEAKKYIQEIVLRFSSTNRQVQEVKLVEPSKDYTRFVLKNTQINKQIHDSVFDY